MGTCFMRSFNHNHCNCWREWGQQGQCHCQRRVRGEWRGTAGAVSLVGRGQGEKEGDGRGSVTGHRGVGGPGGGQLGQCHWLERG